MPYTQFSLYKSFGQFDNTINIKLREGSADFEKYGSNLTGDIFYKDAEKQKYQGQLDNNEQPEEYGKIKIRDLTTNLPKEKRYDLLYDGIDITNITEIFSIPFSKTNLYTDTSIRQLPEPIKINFDASNFDAPRSFIWLFEQSKKDGFKLTEFEELELIGYKIIKNEYRVPEEYKAYEANKELKYFVLHYKFINSSLTDDEDKEFKELIEERSKETTNILFTEIKKGANNNLEFLKDKTDVLNKLTIISALFKSERLCWTKTPIWWNIERYLHILLRHVSGFQFGEINEEKTAFQYEVNDTKNLVEIILKKLTEEINLHFEKYPDRDFKRQGGMSYYYNGDYYVIHIRADGLLMTLYKNS